MVEETSNLGETWTPDLLPPSSHRRDDMQDAMNGQKGSHGQDSKDPRHNPIETNAVPPTDPIVDPLPNGSTKPPYGGPEGGDGREQL